MKILIKQPGALPVEISCTGDVELVGVYNGVGIHTDQGFFGIAQRDSGIEVLLDGKMVWSSNEVK